VQVASQMNHSEKLEQILKNPLFKPLLETLQSCKQNGSFSSGLYEILLEIANIEPNLVKIPNQFEQELEKLVSEMQICRPLLDDEFAVRKLKLFISMQNELSFFKIISMSSKIPSRKMKFM
jgi:hypothetical protein